MIDFSPFIFALFTSLILTPLARSLGLRLGILDTPGELSIHMRSIPRTGGLAMFVAFLMAIGYAWTTGVLTNQARLFVGIVIGSAVIFLSGLLDDIKWVSPRQKFLGEFLGATIAVGFGLQVKTFPLVGAGIFLALFYLVGGANALNLLDGMDGLAAGTAAIAAFFLAILAAAQGNGQALVLALGILGATLGFLPYNWGVSNFEFRISNLQGRRPQAAIFMGDSGSLFSGFILSSIAILFAAKPYDLVGFITPLVVISIPVLDTALAILRRFARRVDPFGGDRQHIYDLLAGTGLGNGRVVLIIYLTTLMLGTLSLVMIRLTPLLVILMATGVVMILCIAAIRLGAVRAPVSQRHRDCGKVTK